MASNKNTPLLFTLRAHRKDCRRSGIGRALGVKANTSLSSVRSRLKSTATTTVIRSNRLMSPGDAMKLKFRMLCARPMTTLAMIVRRNDVMPPMTAATRASDSVWGPRVVRSPAEPLCPAIRMTASDDNPPASAHTMVDTIFGLMLDRRANRGLLAQALTVRPSVVRSRNHVRAISATGAMMRTEISDPLTVTPPTVQMPLIALG